jgi:nucleoside-diphosphate-sugar epimerase
VLKFFRMNLTGVSDADLVIFGCGYLGSYLAETALGQGVRVHALTRNPQTGGRLRELGANVFEGWLEEDAWHSSIPVSPAFAVNCVGALDRTESGYRRSYIGGLKSIARWARGGIPGVFVYTSSTGVYGSASGDVDEDTVPGPLSKKNRLLTEAERLVVDGCLARRWFILRLSGLYGPARHQLLDRVRAGDPELDREVDRRMNIVHRTDACRAILDCLVAPPEIASQVFNVTSDVAASRREMIQWLTRHSRHEKVGSVAPGFVRDRAVPDRLVSNKRIREVLGWRPLYPDFRAGYKAILAAE